MAVVIPGYRILEPLSRGLHTCEGVDAVNAKVKTCHWCRLTGAFA